MFEYQLVSPSLDGIIRHGSTIYGDVERPHDILRAFDRPLRNESAKLSDEDREALKHYFDDLYGVLMKKLSLFAVAADAGTDEPMKLQAMLQELIKVKRIIAA